MHSLRGQTKRRPVIELVFRACSDAELCHTPAALSAKHYWMLLCSRAYPCNPAEIFLVTLCDFLYSMKWKHQSLKSLLNPSVVWMLTSMAVQLVAAITVNQSLCRSGVILMHPRCFYPAYPVLFISAVLRLLLISYVVILCELQTWCIRGRRSRITEH